MIELHEEEILIIEKDGTKKTMTLGSAEAFKLLSRLWLRSGWDTKYVYSFTWFGRPIIQLPEDMIRIQEIIYRVKPDVIIETGIAHGGSLVFYAGLLKAMGTGRVIGVDIEIRPHNREAIESHSLYEMITMFEGSSIDESIVSQIRSNLTSGETCLVILDSNHTRKHVLEELRMYSEFVTVDSYMVACDGIMKDLIGAPRSNSDWDINNPQSAVNDFIAENSDFILEEPSFLFNEGQIKERVTYWPNAYLRRIK